MQRGEQCKIYRAMPMLKTLRVLLHEAERSTLNIIAMVLSGNQSPAVRKWSAMSRRVAIQTSGLAAT